MKQGRTTQLWLFLFFSINNSLSINYICEQAAIKSLPFCNTSLSFEARANDLVLRIPINDIPGLLADNSTGSRSVGIPPYSWWNEALHGIGVSPGVKFQSPTPVATSFPQIIGLACSFNTKLFHKIGNVIGIEGRAFGNSLNSGYTFWAPNINIFRDPRWGRGQETPGEDPFLNGEYAVHFVQGMQTSNGSKYQQVSACCKHFSGYSQEVPRHSLNAVISKQDLADTYLPAFEACVTRGKVSSIMCSYNSVNGIPSCADKHFLTDVIRKKWKFDGYITSDCGAVEDIEDQHHYTNSSDETCKAVIEAGMDLNCGWYFQNHLLRAIQNDRLNHHDLLRAMKNLFKVQMRLGMFEPSIFSNISHLSVNTKYHQRLAVEAVHESIVLLKNENKLLPLNADDFITKKTLGIIGPHSNATTAMLGNYQGIPPFIISPYDGIRHYVGSLKYVEGCSIVGDKDAVEFQKARKLASSVDQLIVFVGLNITYEGEGMDRNSIDFPGVQSELIQMVLQVTKNPIVLVLITGGPVNLSQLKTSSSVGSILYAGYPGQGGGQAIADTIFGLNNPSGRLTQTFYSAEAVSQFNISDMGFRPSRTNPGRTYRFYTGNPVYEFGIGLSYTSFEYDWSDEILWIDDINMQPIVLQTKVRVRNTGHLVGSTSILCFASPPFSGTMGRPKSSLVFFKKIHNLQPGQVNDVIVKLSSKAFMVPNANGEFEIIYGKWKLTIGNKSHIVHVWTKKELELVKYSKGYSFLRRIYSNSAFKTSLD